MCKPLIDHYLGIVVDDIKTLRKRIQKFDYQKSIKKIKKYREENSIENNIDRLMLFVDGLGK